MAISKKSKKNKPQQKELNFEGIESAPNRSAASAAGGRPSFKKDISETMKSRKIDVASTHLDRLIDLKRKGIAEGLDHAIYLALNDLFDKHDV